MAGKGFLPCIKNRVIESLRRHRLCGSAKCRTQGAHRNESGESASRQGAGLSRCRSRLPQRFRINKPSVPKLAVAHQASIRESLAICPGIEAVCQRTTGEFLGGILARAGCKPPLPVSSTMNPHQPSLSASSIEISEAPRSSRCLAFGFCFSVHGSPSGFVQILPCS